MVLDAKSDPGRFTILVVDNEEPTRGAKVRALEQAGYRVRPATSADALEAAPGTDLVVIDIRIPELDGISLERRLEADPRIAGMPVLRCAPAPDSVLTANIALMLRRRRTDTDLFEHKKMEA